MRSLVSGADATIAINGTASSAVPVLGDFLTVKLPTLVSGTITVQGSLDGTNFYPIWDGGRLPVAFATAATTGDIIIAGIPVFGVSFVKFVSSASQITTARVFKTAFSS